MPRFEIPDGWRMEAFDFALDPTPAQRRALASHAGARRFAFNWGLGLVKDRLDVAARVRAAALTEQLPDSEVERLARTVVVPWTLPALRKEWNAAKSAVVDGVFKGGVLRRAGGSRLRAQELRRRQIRSP